MLAITSASVCFRTKQKTAGTIRNSKKLWGGKARFCFLHKEKKEGGIGGKERRGGRGCRFFYYYSPPTLAQDIWVMDGCSAVIFLVATPLHCATHNAPLFYSSYVCYSVFWFAFASLLFC